MYLSKSSERKCLCQIHFRYSVTNAQWEIIEPLLPKAKSTGRPGLNPRTVFNAIMFVLSGGGAWRDIPKESGNWNSFYHKFRHWIALGVFEKILKALTTETEKYFLLEMVSTFCKVHQHAKGARKILGNQDIGVSRGGKTTKIHALVNENFQLVKVLLSAGNFHDSEFALDLLDGINLDGKAVLADMAYYFERFFQRIKNFRHIATRYDKLSVCFQNFVLLGAIMIQL